VGGCDVLYIAKKYISKIYPKLNKNGSQIDHDNDISSLRTGSLHARICIDLKPAGKKNKAI
jgi:hypothetical protein